MEFRTALAGVEFFYRRVYWQSPGAVTHSTPDYTLTYSGVTWLHSINQLWLHRPEALDDTLLKYAGAFFANYNAEYSIVFPDAPLDPAGWLLDRRFVERAVNPIYALHGLPHPPHTNTSLRIVRAGEAHKEMLLQMLYSVFFIGPEIGRCLVRPGQFEDSAIRHYLAFVGDEPAACTTLLLDGETAGIWNVGTMRAYRRQGLAATLVAHALAEAADAGCNQSVLVASPMGRPLYEAMGYQRVGSTYHYGLTDE